MDSMACIETDVAGNLSFRGIPVVVGASDISHYDRFEHRFEFHGEVWEKNPWTGECRRAEAQPCSVMRPRPICGVIGDLLLQSMDFGAEEAPSRLNKIIGKVREIDEPASVGADKESRPMIDWSEHPAVPDAMKKILADPRNEALRPIIQNQLDRWEKNGGWRNFASEDAFVVIGDLPPSDPEPSAITRHDYGRTADDAKGLVPLPKREPPERVVPAFPATCYRALIG